MRPDAPTLWHAFRKCLKYQILIAVVIVSLTVWLKMYTPTALESVQTIVMVRLVLMGGVLMLAVLAVSLSLDARKASSENFDDDDDETDLDRQIRAHAMDKFDEF